MSGKLAAAALVSLAAVFSTGAGAAPAGQPFEGLYQQDGVGPKVRVVFAAGRYELRAAGATKLKNNCKVYVGDVRYALKPLGGEWYVWSELVYTYDGKLGHTGGERKDGCRRAMGKSYRTRATLSPKGTLRIYCSYATSTICFSYVRVKEAAARPTLVAQPTSVAPGRPLTLAVSGFPANTTLAIGGSPSIDFAALVPAPLQTDTAGSLTRTVTIPAGTARGDYMVEVWVPGQVQTWHAVAYFRVT